MSVPKRKSTRERLWQGKSYSRVWKVEGAWQVRENSQRCHSSGNCLMDRTNLDGVLVLTGEGVDGSLLDTLLAL